MNFSLPFFWWCTFFVHLEPPLSTWRRTFQDGPFQCQYFSTFSIYALWGSLGTKIKCCDLENASLLWYSSRIPVLSVFVPSPTVMYCTGSWCPVNAACEASRVLAATSPCIRAGLCIWSECVNSQLHTVVYFKIRNEYTCARFYSVLKICDFACAQHGAGILCTCARVGKFARVQMWIIPRNELHKSDSLVPHIASIHSRIWRQTLLQESASLIKSAQGRLSV